METWVIIVVFSLLLLIVVGVVIAHFTWVTSPPQPAPIPFAPIVQPPTPSTPPTPPTPTPPTSSIPQVMGIIDTEIISTNMLNAFVTFSAPTTSARATISRNETVVSASSLSRASHIIGASAWAADFRLSSNFLINGHKYIITFTGVNGNIVGPSHSQTFIYQDDPDAAPEVDHVTFSGGDNISVIVVFDAPSNKIMADLSFGSTNLIPSEIQGGGLSWNLVFNTRSHPGTTYTLRVKGAYETLEGSTFTSTFIP